MAKTAAEKLEALLDEIRSEAHNETTRRITKALYAYGSPDGGNVQGLKEEIANYGITADVNSDFLAGITCIARLLGDGHLDY